ncbi:MAG: NAD(P)/FAD-dependent oxidoreductase [Sumerlaeia bacterium]
MTTNRRLKVSIIGAGLAGLSCALRLRSLGVDYHLYEASDDVGGRVRTDIVEDFRLDRGFQVLLEAYPETQRVLDYPSLELERFEPGAKVYFDGKFHTVADPLRRPLHAFESLQANIASLSDKLKVPFWKQKIDQLSIKEIFTSHEQTTLEYLQDCGFSPIMIDRFFRPFLSGIFLETQLSTSSSMAKFVMKMMSTGAVAVPRFGMGAISNQLADRVGRENMSFNSIATNVTPTTVELQDGSVSQSDAVVIATERTAAFRLLGQMEPSNSWTTVQCHYYAAPKAPINGAWLALNGETEGPVNNLVVMSNVSENYAPKNAHLISVSVVDEQFKDSKKDVHSPIMNQLEEWFGNEVNAWEHLKTYTIPKALPKQPKGYFTERRIKPNSKGVYICGDYCEMGSIQGAMHSGRMVAEKIHAR